MQLKKHFQLIRRDINDLLTSLSSTPDLHNTVNGLVNIERYNCLDKKASNKPWFVLPLIVCQSISGHYQHAVPASVALYLMNTAAEVFDDTEDNDSYHSILAQYGSGIAVNVATTLLILAEKSIVKLKAKGVEDAITIRVIDSLNSYYTTACTGQHLDLTLTSEATVSEDVYFRITGLKSASTVECACHIGALLANASQELVDMFSQLGYNLGISSQIANDIEGITGGRDINTLKITLPVIYALNHTTGVVRDFLENTYIKRGGYPIDTQGIIDVLFSSGAIQYSVIQMELFKQKALDILEEIEMNSVNVEQLRVFLHS